MPLLLPINEKARPMIEKELQVAVREIKRIFVCKTELRDACLDQLRQSLTSTRNNLTRDYIDNYIRQGNKKNVVVVWNERRTLRQNYFEEIRSRLPNFEYNLI